MMDKTQSIYQQIANNMIKKIITNELKNNDMLPSIREQARSYQVTPKTVQNAMKKLEALGLIKKVQGSGIYVSVDENQRQTLIQNEIHKIFQQFIKEMNQIGFSKEKAKIKFLEACDD